MSERLEFLSQFSLKFREIKDQFYKAHGPNIMLNLISWDILIDTRIGSMIENHVGKFL